MAMDSPVIIGASPENRPNAAPRFSVYSIASQPSTISTPDPNRPDPILETRMNFVSWSIAVTEAATATNMTASLRSGMERLLALDERLALDTVGHIGKRFETLFADRFPAALARAVRSLVHAFERRVDLGQDQLHI